MLDQLLMGRFRGATKVHLIVLLALMVTTRTPALPVQLTRPVRGATGWLDRMLNVVLAMVMGLVLGLASVTTPCSLFADGALMVVTFEIRPPHALGVASSWRVLKGLAALATAGRGERGQVARRVAWAVVGAPRPFRPRPARLPAMHPGRSCVTRYTNLLQAPGRPGRPSWRRPLRGGWSAL